MQKDLIREKARLFEVSLKINFNKAISDNELEEFLELDIFFKNQLDITQLKNEWKQTPLHVACLSGSVDVLVEILKKYNKKSISEQDKYGHTPLDLTCSKGFQNKNKQLFEDLGGVKMTRRSKCIEILINHFELKTKTKNELFINLKNYKDGKNTPLHWAIYYGDAYMAYLVFKQNPLQVFIVNRNHCTPFDIIWMTRDESLRAYQEIVISLLF